MIELLVIPLGIIIIGIVVLAFSWYRIVPPSEAHLVATPHDRFVASPDEGVSTDGKRAYFALPSFIPFVGRNIRVLDMTIKELVDEQETYEKNQARYQVKSSTKYRIKNVKRAAETFTNDEELKQMLQEVVRASVRAVTVKHDVTEARANKQLMGKAITEQMIDDLEGWGLELVNFQLVDFQDTQTSKIISDISLRREIEIQSETRERNAEKIKQARLKEAESEEKARTREIEKDRVIGEQNQIMQQKIREKEKEAKEKEYDVIRVATVRQADITKEAAIVKANQDKETEEINKEQKRLLGEGDKLRDMEKAKGEAAPIREKGFAEAEAKEKLQAALNKFGDEAIRALVAEKIVEKDRAVGIEAAKALAAAEIKAFMGGDGAKSSFDLGKALTAIGVANPSAADSALNRVGIPNDLGFDKKSFVVGNEAAKKKGKK